eukprot:TRINITY_DN5720_c0_g1_i1.p1 TRINITY_DN5720_c0_g1~~TRINITY_DN5720_c0_g1_i1.p1  ORF type:complete len:529 (-),score=152.15 TRINITY_DN5720_c0_g1_i1:1727-3127(-)
MEEVKSSVWSFVEKVSALATGDLTPEQAGMTFVNKQLIAMEFPSNLVGLNGVPIENMGKYLKTKHAGRFMVYNLSDRHYEYSFFDDQVLEFRFPGYPAPPLDKIFSICRSIDGWIRADDANVAAVHCQTGKGRTVTVLACYLAWAKEFPSAKEAAEHIAQLKQVSLQHLLIPTQLRYLNYFDDLMQSKFPSPKVVKIQRVIVSTVPNFVKEPAENEKGGCRPYLQIFKHATLLYSSAKNDDLRWYRTDDGSFLFPVGIDVEGDILVRVRHMGDKDNRVTMFRVGLHTGYLPDGITRFEKKDVDGAATSNRFDKDFFVDLILSPSVDGEGKEVVNPVEPEYWSTITHRSPRPVKTNPQPKIAQPFSLFADDGKVSSPKGADDDDDSYAELEKYVQGLDGVDAKNLDVESGDEDAEILKVIQSHQAEESPSPKPANAEKGDEHHDVADAEGADVLDDDIQAILNKLED